MGTQGKPLPTPLGRQASFLSSSCTRTNLSRGRLRPVTASKELILDEVDFEAPKVEVIAEDGSSDDYDTDIEIDEKCATSLDLNGAVIYRRTCRKLGILPIKSMGAMLAKSTIRLRHRVIGPVGALALSNALLVNGNVTVLHIDGNNIGPKGTRYICWMLLESEIKDLSLSDNNIGQIGAGAIAECLAQNRTLVRLNLSSNDLGNDEAHFISTALKVNRDLDELDLSKNSFGDDSCSALGSAIGINEGLRTIDLSWNKIRMKGTAALVKGLLRNDTLRCLKLSGNGVANEGAKSIAQVIRRNATITELDICENRIFDSGLLDMSKALKFNKDLEVLRVANNPITSYGALGLLESLCKNKENVLKTLDISTTHIHTQAMGKISTIKEDNPDFQCLYGGTLTTPINKVVDRGPHDCRPNRNSHGTTGQGRRR
ncbi:leucine-rich repeat-containing protein 74B-like isoform X2 [Lineus longissimus]|uniref:leucine-rich repeat-containing protein 74B-like isoform X2 n=1 Tax=Lineus longissimus TaxID=88925 RepID=UPI002B4EA4DA